MLFSILLFFLFFLYSGSSRAGEPEYTSPQPLTIPGIIYPTGFSEPVSGMVTVRFTITPEGEVTDAVALSASHPFFIPPVLTALKQAKFIPAQWNGTSVSSVVETTISISPPPSPRYGVLKGTIKKRGSRDPVVGAEVRGEGGGSLAVTTSDEEGRFSLTFSPGVVTIGVYAPGFLPYRTEEAIEEGEVVTVVYRLTPLFLNTLEVIIEGERPRQEISRLTLKTQEIRAVPGTFDDVLRVAQKLPGVATPSELSGQLLIRGSDNRDNRVYVDDLPLLLLYHFGALKSVIASELIQDVNLYPSNFSVHYGDALGGILEVRLRDPRPDQVQGRAMVSTILSEGVFEAPLLHNTGMLLAARRSYLDLFFHQIFPEERTGLTPVVVPWFYDYQGRVVHLRGTWTVRATVLGTKDRFEFVVPPERNLYPEFFTGVDLTSEEHTQMVRSTYAQNPLTHETTLGMRESRQKVQLSSDQFFELKGLHGAFRHETIYSFAPGWRLTAGLDIKISRPAIEFTAPRPPRQGEFDYDPFTAPLSSASVSYRVDREGVYSSLHYEGELAWMDLGVRSDRDGRSEVTTLDPRLSGGFRLGSPGDLRWGAGVFHQFAQLEENAPIVGEPRVGPSRGIHLLLGWGRDLPGGFNTKVETFYKLFDRLIIPTRDPLAPERYRNKGKGRAYGGEFTLMKPLTGNLFGWMNYSYVRSFRTDLKGKEEPFRFDQPHILNLILTYLPTIHWELGFSLRYASGNPLKSVTDRFYYGDQGFYLPLREHQGERLPPYLRLDLRGKYTFLFPTWNLSILLEILNATMHTNVLGVTYNRDYTQRSFIQSFPILPYLGVEGRF